MRKLRFSILLITVLSFVAFSCGKDDVPAVNCGKFYQLVPYEVGVNPKTRKVEILFQTLGCEGEGISGLTVNDFEVVENGFSMDSEADIRIDPGQIPYSVRTVLLLDITRSVEGLVDQIKEASLSVVNSKLANQQIAVYAFDKQLKLIQNFTDDKNLLTQAIESIPETGLESSTNLYGALIDLNIKDMWEESFSLNFIEDGSLILFTDGRHNANQTQTLEMALASRGDKKLYVAALNSNDLVEDPLRQLASTGGYFLAEDISRLKQVFENIQQEIESLSGSIYYLFYTSPISDPTPIDNELIIKVRNNTNRLLDGQIKTTFNSAGFQ